MSKNQTILKKISLAWSWTNSCYLVEDVSSNNGLHWSYQFDAAPRLLKIDGYGMDASSHFIRKGSKKTELKLSERTYICEYCNLEIDRDLNASINLKNLGTCCPDVKSADSS